MSSSLNKFLHGTLWRWVPNELALIISNDEYNSQSSKVNCVSVTGISDDSINIDNVQCNQIHTVEKEALSDFMGAVPDSILAVVKAKIQKQFNMGDDKALHAIQETAAKLIDQLTRIDSNYVNPAVESVVVVPVVQETQPLNTIVDTDAEGNTDNAAPTTKQARKPRGKKPKQPKKTNTQTSKPKREIQNYTDEDETFVLDGNPTTEEIMERFGFTVKRKVADLKYNLKKRRDKRESK
jgi:mRNA-degrading endonuclease toxin of MazEF toxin-antitoxin module